MSSYDENIYFEMSWAQNSGNGVCTLSVKCSTAQMSELILIKFVLK